MSIEIDVSAEAGADVAVVGVAGDLDLSTAPELERSLTGVQTDGRPVVLDLRRLSFMDSSGLRVILAADARARSAGTRLVLVEGPPGVQRVFQLTLLDRRLEFVTDPAEIQG
ncbi:MAG TPA: STAS domain-containing protein [Actinomycetota bacterium]|jgi:anti-sigma B factor antagonist|nr:STAS domain-containing protein [Actinomycetota bacterium]